jgi:hypothetical protein
MPATLTIQPQGKIFNFIVTLLNRCTGDEQSFEIHMATDSFLPVLRESQRVRHELGLGDYEIYEALDLNSPF